MKVSGKVISMTGGHAHFIARDQQDAAGRVDYARARQLAQALVASGSSLSVARIASAAR